MAINDSDGGYASARSASGGLMLSAIDGVETTALDALAQYGITDAEQVIALAALPDVRPSLEEALGGSDLDALVAQLRSNVGEVAAIAIENSPPAALPLGAMEPSPEIQTEMQTMMSAGPGDAMALPASIDHALSMSPVRNQGGRGTCVAFAMTAMHESYRRKTGFPNDFSEQFLYHRTKAIDGSSACGTWAVKAAQVLSGQGECLESVGAYNPNAPCNNNGVMPGNALTEAAKYKLPAIVLNPKDVNAIKAALASGCTCEFSVPVWNSWYSSAATRSTGRITMKLPGGTMSGGNAMCFIGYQDDSSSPGGGFFILRNSWGTGWGSACPYGAGNGTVPYQYIANDGWEAVTTPVPRRRLIWDDWRWRRFDPRPFDPRPFDPRPFGEGEGNDGPSPRRTIMIEDGDADIIIR